MTRRDPYCRPLQPRRGSTNDRTSLAFAQSVCDELGLETEGCEGAGDGASVCLKGLRVVRVDHCDQVLRIQGHHSIITIA